MKCTSNRGIGERTGRTLRLRLLLVLLLCVCISASGCGMAAPLSFEENAEYSTFNFLVRSSGAAQVADPFAADLCVVNTNVIPQDVVLPDVADDMAAALFDVSGRRTIYASNANMKVYPASLTKVMTSLVALKYSSPDEILTASENVVINEANVTVAGLQPGDTMTLSQALNLLLINSANDVAILIAENIGGSVNEFIRMMNAEAARLGATNTNFINSNGLTDENHYTTLYDLYLIFSAALKYETFTEIISRSRYTTVYHDRNGLDKEVDVYSTNNYLMSYSKPPAGITVVGGKTGTTYAAGHCLMVLCRDTLGKPYIGVVMKAPTNEKCYAAMNELMDLIPR